MFYRRMQKIFCSDFVTKRYRFAAKTNQLGNIESISLQNYNNIASTLKETFIYFMSR